MTEAREGRELSNFIRYHEITELMKLKESVGKAVGFVTKPPGVVVGVNFGKTKSTRHWIIKVIIKSGTNPKQIVRYIIKNREIISETFKRYLERSMWFDLDLRINRNDTARSWIHIPAEAKEESGDLEFNRLSFGTKNSPRDLEAEINLSNPGLYRCKGRDLPDEEDLIEVLVNEIKSEEAEKDERLTDVDIRTDTLHRRTVNGLNIIFEKNVTITEK